MICKLCTQNDKRPGIYFEGGICGACLYEKEKETIDWTERKRELDDIVAEAKAKNKTYDCVVGVSGGKDSTFQALYSRDVLGLHTLLVSGEPEGITEVGRYNLENLIQQGFDCIKLRPNPKVLKQMVRRDFLKHLNFVKITEYSLWSSAYIIADKFDIPLILQGENVIYTHGARGTGLSAGGSCLDIKKHNTLAEPLKEYGVDEEHLFMYNYDMDGIIKKGIKGVWLQYYVREWSGRYNLEFSQKIGLKTRKDFGEFRPEDYGVHEDFYQMDGAEWATSVNQFLKWVKFGFGQCADSVNYDIRAGYLTREEGLELVAKYDGKIADRFIKGFCDYIEITTDEFWETIRRYRESH